MNNQFDQLTRSLAQSVTRRAALKKFSLGFAGMALACFGLPSKAKATTLSGYCQAEYSSFIKKTMRLNGVCIGAVPQLGCVGIVSADCQVGERVGDLHLGTCGYVSSKK